MKRGVALLLLAACQPQARRLLLLDLTLSDPVVLNGTAQPWREAGYTVEHRRFYPHLTWSDVERYRAVVVLCGREPEAPSDALTLGDVALLNEWVLRGGVVILGYDGDGEGSLDRWITNSWLAYQGAGISVGDRPLEDTTMGAGGAITDPRPWVGTSPVGGEPLGDVYDPFPLDHNHALTVRDSAQVLAVASRQAFVRTPRGPAPSPDAPIAAAVRTGGGLVVVISRNALGALGPRGRAATTPILAPDALTRTHEFLTALARWTLRPAEWAHVSPAGRAAALALQQAPAPLEPQPPRLAPPLVAAVVELPLASDRRLAAAPNAPDWLRQQGIRALWTPLLPTRAGRHVTRAPAALDSLIRFLDSGGFNLLAGDADPEGADSLRTRWEERLAVRHAWSDAINRLEPTSVAWIPVLDHGDVRAPLADSSRGARGEALAAPCVFDTAYWAATLASGYTALGRLAADQRTLVIALGLDFGGPGSSDRAYSMGQEFCDAAWRPTLKRLGKGGIFDAVPVAERYRLLREAGLLSLYYRTLQDQVAERAGALRDHVLRQRKDLYFAFRFPQLPADWFSLGMLRGFALSDRPLLLFTPEARTREALALYRASGLNAVHAVELSPALLRSRDWAGLHRVVFEENDGFWLRGEAVGAAGRGGGGPGTGRPASAPASDTLARLVRRLAR